MKKFLFALSLSLIASVAFAGDKDYVIGYEGNWSTTNHPLTDNNDGTYSITLSEFNLSQGFKIYEYDSWTPQWGANDSAIIPEIPYKATYSTTGEGIGNIYIDSFFKTDQNNVTVTFNPSTGEITLSNAQSIDNVYLVGSFNGWDISNNYITLSSNGSNLFTANSSALNGEFKVLRTRDWNDVSLGGAMMSIGQECQLSQTGMNIASYTSAIADATITFDAIKRTIKVEGNPTFNFPESIYLVGAPSGWTYPGSENQDHYNNWAIPAVEGHPGMYSRTFDNISADDNSQVRFRFSTRLDGWDNGSIGLHTNESDVAMAMNENGAQAPMFVGKGSALVPDWGNAHSLAINVNLAKGILTIISGDAHKVTFDNTSEQWSKVFVHYYVINSRADETPVTFEMSEGENNIWHANIPATATHIRYSNNEDLSAENVRKSSLLEATPENLAYDSNVITGISTVSLSDDVAPVFYNLQGIRIANPVNGAVYIRVQGNNVDKIRF